MTVERRSAIGAEEAHTSGLYTKRPIAIVRGERAAVLVVDERSVAADDRERPFRVEARSVRVLAAHR